MESRLSHVIFDLDGTLLDSEPLYTLAAERVCARYGKPFTLELKRAIMGGDTQHGARTVVAALALPISPEAYIHERERELVKLWPSLTPMPSAPAIVDALRARGIGLALATSGHRAVTETKLGYQPFLQSIAVRVCGDDPRLSRGKPAPDIFLLAAAELGVAPAQCMVVEDSRLGVQAGLAAGMRTVALVDTRYGFTDEQFAGAVQIVHSLADIDLSLLEAPSA